MPDLEISNLPSLAEASVQATDPLPIADLSASETKKVTVKDLIEAGVALIDSASIPGAKIGTLGTNQVATAAIQDLAVTTAKIANGAITVTQIADATITGAKLVNNTITATQIAANAIGTSELADNAVDTGAIANNAITNVKINNGEIVYAKLNITDGDIPAAKITGNSITSAQIGADAVGASELADNAVDTAAVVDAAITGAKIATDTIGSGNIAANAIGASELADNAVDTGAIASNAVTTAKIADDQVTAAKLANNLAGTILATGAIGSTQIAANAVTSSELADNAVDTAAIAASAVTDAKVASGISGTKLTDGTVTAAKLNTSNINRSLNVASGSLGINNAITAATRSGITYNAQGLITGTVALAASDLPLATTSAVGGVSIGAGLTVSGAGALSITNSVTGATVSGITFNNQGAITAATGLVAGDLPTATTSAKGAVQITSAGGLSVDGSGNLTTSTSGISAGTYTKLTVNTKGVATAGTTLSASDIPSLDATKITTGSIAAARIGNDTIDGSKLSNTSTAIFQSIAQSGYPTAQFNGQILFDTVSEDAFIWDGNAWQAITTLTKGSLVFGGTYNASTSKMASTTTAGIAAGLAVGSNLPTPSATTDGVYVVVDVAGTPSAPAPVVSLSPPDYILGVTNSAGSSWNEIDLSQTVAGQVASNITFTPYGQLSSTNVQDALQELETEKMGLAGGTVTGQLLIGNTGSLVFEGSTVDAYETTITVADPTTSDKTITFPDITGTVITSGDTNTVTSTMVDGSLVNANLASGAAIAFSKLAALTSAQIIVGNGSNVPTAVAVTGDIGINNAGLTSITAGAIVNADINASAAIAGSKITTGTTSAVGVLQLTDSATSTSATTAATPAAVKIAKDAADAAATTANAALPKAGGTMTGNLIIDNAKEIRFSEADGDGANYTGLKAQAQSSDITLTLPAVAPTTGQVLKAGSTATTLEWATDSATDATKLPLAGGTMSGAIAMGTSKITGLGDPTAAQDAATKTYVDTADALKLNLAGGTLTGNLTLNAQSDVRFADADSSAYVALQAPSTVGSSYTLTLPAADGTNGQALISDGSGNLSFTSISTGAAGSNTQVQFNNSGAFAGSSSLTFNSGTGALTATSFVGALTGNVTGNASGSSGSCTGNAATASLAAEFTVTANNTADETVYPLFVDGATGSQGAETDTGLTYNPSSGLLTSTGFAGALTGNVTGNVSGSAATVTGAAQSAITSLGTLTGLTVSGDVTLTADSAELRVESANGVDQFVVDSDNGNTTIAGNLTVDTNTLHVDATNNRVGIGTTSPTELLDVSSTGASTAIEISAGEASTTTGEAKLVLRSLHSSSGTGYSRSEIASLGVAGGDSDLIFRTTTDNNGPQERMRIDSAGKVGINQTPTRELSLHSPDNNNALIHFTNDDTGETASDGILVGLDGNENMVINNQETGKTINFHNGGSQRMQLDSSGRLLVGVTGSTSLWGINAQLQVEGTNGDTSSLSITRNTNDAGGPYLILAKSRGTSDGSHTIVQSGDRVGTIAFVPADGTNKGHSNAQIAAEIDGTPGTDDLPSRLLFLTTADGANTPTERMRIDKSGHVQVSTGQFTVGTTASTGLQFISDGTFGTLHSSELKLRTASGERFRIGTAGQLGIGGANYGSSGQVLTSGGGGAAPSWQDAGGGGGTVELTASGAITAERAVMVNSNGTVSQVSGASASNGSLTNHVQAVSGGSTRQRAASNNNGKFLILENNMNGSNTILYATIATVTGTSVSFGSTVTVTTLLNDDSVQIFDVCYHEADDKFFVVYTDTNEAIVGRVLTYSGSTITVGSDSDIYNNGGFPVREVACAYDPDEERILSFFSAGSNRNGYVKDITLFSTTAFTAHNTNGVSSGTNNVNFPKIHYNTHGNYFYCVWDQDSNTSRMVKVSWNGTTYQPTYSSGTAFGWLSEDYEGQVGLTCIGGTNLAVLVYKTGANNLYAKMVEYDGSSYSAHTATTIVTSGSMVNSIAFDASNERIICCVNGTNQVGNIVILSYNTTAKTLTVESTTQIWTASHISINACYMSYDSTNNKALAHKGTSSSATYNQSIVVQRPSTDLNADRYIGFSTGSVNDGATATIAIADAGITSTQSSLTPATKYYVQADGTIGTSAVNPSVVAGVALTSTKLLIRN